MYVIIEQHKSYFYIFENIIESILNIPLSIASLLCQTALYEVSHLIPQP